MGRSKLEEKMDEPTPEGYIYVYTNLIERLEVEQTSTEPGSFWHHNGCQVMEKYQRELEKWKNHISIKG